MAFRAHSFDAFDTGKLPPRRRRVGKIPAPPQDPAIDELRRLMPAADGRVLVPGVDPAAEDLLPFNLRTQVIPRVIASCRTARGVSLSLDWAQRHGVPLRCHSGGHAYEGDCSVAGLMIDVRPMTQVTVNTTRMTASVGAGWRTLELTEALFAQGVAVPLGTCSPVGIAGVTLGGGHGLAARKFGLTLDHLRSVRLVMADGSETVADAGNKADLFWALRGGGGGNFGIVTGFEFQVQRVDRVALFRIKWRTASADAAMAAWQDFMETAPDEISSVMVVGGRAGTITGIRCAGQFLPRLAGHTPDVAELRRLLRSLSNIAHLDYTVREVNYLEAARYFAGTGDTQRVYFKGKSDYALAPLNATARTTLLDALRASTEAVDVIFEGYGGAVNRVAADATAFPHRGATRFCMQYFAEWSAASATTARTNAVRAVHRAMRPHLPGLCYANYMDADLAQPVQSYYGANLARLQQVKRTYDPGNIFRFPQSIPLP